MCCVDVYFTIAKTRLEELQKLNANDVFLDKDVKYCKEGWHAKRKGIKNFEIRYLHRLRYDLYTNGGVSIYGTEIVIPRGYYIMLTKLNTGHFNIKNTKSKPRYD